ncbi:MAG TPA: HAD family hydrolase [Ktedonobacterales bacterium]|nr:HAD family hydrolase [Ktedonobacterales bacterium]
MATGREYQLILFDLDGTLTDPKPGITRAVRYALERCAIYIDDPDTLTSFIGPPLHHSFARVYGFDDERAREAIGFYREYFEATGLYENAVYPGIPYLLERLRASGRSLAVATSKPTVYAQRIVDHFRLGGYFSQVVGSNLDLTRAEKAQVIGAALDVFPDIARAAVVMVGDREHDIIGARAHDLDSIGVTYGYGSRAELHAAGARAIVDRVQDLADLLL